MHFPQFAHQDHGRHGAKTFQRLERGDGRRQPPFLEQVTHRRFAALDPFPGRCDPLEILFQDGFHGWMGQDQLAQVTFMGRAPTALALVTIPVTQEEAF